MKEEPNAHSDISVIITTYNDACYLPKALDSIERQKLKPKEVIVIDDGSDDDFASDFVSGKAYAFPVFAYKKENGGASEARNYGLNKATGEFVAFLDVDDFWLEDNLIYKYEKLKDKSSEFFGCYGGYISKPLNIISNFKKNEDQVVNDDIGKIDGFPGGAPMYLFRRKLLVDVGGFDKNLKQNEDFDLILRLIQSGYKVTGDNFFGYIRNLRTGSLTRNDNCKSTYNNVSIFLNKAENNNYFSYNELQQRRTLIALSCLKKCFLRNKEFSFQAMLLEEALKNKNLKNIQYFPLIIYKILLDGFLWIK